MALTGDNDADLQNPLWGDGWRDIRALFPMEPGYAHLNNGSFGAAPVPVLEAQAEWRSRADANTTRFYRREIQPALEEARLATSEFLGADPAGLTLVANVTTGIAAVLGTVPLEPGDEILATDHNYLATLMAVARTCEETGARLVTVAIPLTASEDEITEAILSGVTDRTRLAVIDHITSATARRFPVERIVPALQERGVAVCVDAAHTPGMLPVDLESLAPDFWTGNLHKWAYAPRAAAPLYASAKWRETMRPLIVSWRTPEGFPHAFLQYGTADLSPLLAAPAGQRFLADLGADKVRAHNARLAAHGQAVVADALGVDPSTLPADDGVAMRVVPIPVDLSGGYDFQAVISDRLHIEVGMNAWNGLALLRVSANVYNAPGEYELLAERLPSLF